MPDHRRKSRRVPHWHLTWRYFLRGFGLVAAGWEIWFQHADRPDLLVLIGGCLGLPEFFRDRTGGPPNE